MANLTTNTKNYWQITLNTKSHSDPQYRTHTAHVNSFATRGLLPYKSHTNMASVTSRVNQQHKDLKWI